MESINRQRRVLVVDDDATLCETIARHMRRIGFLVETAYDARAAFLSVEQSRVPFDVVITDVHMPGMSGVDLTAGLLERRPAQRIVMITGDPDQALAREAISRGPVSYLLKPFELFELESAVRQSIEAGRALATLSVSGPASPSQPTVGTVPAEWLHWVDNHSYAGAGHSARVVRICRELGTTLDPSFGVIALAELDIAAWSHEIGLLAGPFPNPVEMVCRSADLLVERGSGEAVAQAVRHMHERWDGSGGPDRLRGLQIPRPSQVLAVADAVDHYSSAWILTGIEPRLAAERALNLVASQENTCFNPELTGVLKLCKEAIVTICSSGRVGSEAA